MLARGDRCEPRTINKIKEGEGGWGCCSAGCSSSSTPRGTRRTASAPARYIEHSSHSSHTSRRSTLATGFRREFAFGPIVALPAVSLGWRFRHHLLHLKLRQAAATPATHRVCEGQRRGGAWGRSRDRPHRPSVSRKRRRRHLSQVRLNSRPQNVGEKADIRDDDDHRDGLRHSTRRGERWGEEATEPQRQQRRVEGPELDAIEAREGVGLARGVQDRRYVH